MRACTYTLSQYFPSLHLQFMQNYHKNCPSSACPSPAVLVVPVPVPMSQFGMSQSRCPCSACPSPAVPVPHVPVPRVPIPAICILLAPIFTHIYSWAQTTLRPYNGISVGSADLPGPTVVTNTQYTDIQTDRQTDRRRYYTCSNSSHLAVMV